VVSALKRDFLMKDPVGQLKPLKVAFSGKTHILSFWEIQMTCTRLFTTGEKQNAL
jgi:hypothetical protein